MNPIPIHDERDAIINPRFPITQTQLADFCARYHIHKLSLFGSVLRDDFKPNSDIDVLIESILDENTTLFTMGAAQMEISAPYRSACRSQDGRVFLANIFAKG